MSDTSLFQRLKERKLVQWAVAYLAGAWVVFEATGTALDAWNLSPLLVRSIHVLLIVGFFITLVIAWYHGEKGRQRVSGPELLMVAALLIIAGVALTMLGRGQEAPQTVEATAPAGSGDARPSLAVLPMDNLSPDPQDAFFARGVHTDITNALGRISSLALKGRYSVDQFPERRPPIREIASALNVDFLLGGTAQIVGTAVKVTVQLIDARLDEQIWEGEWQAEYLPAEAIRIQSEIADSVASELSIAIAPEEEARIAKIPTDDPVALKLVDRAEHLWSQRTESTVQEAIELFDQAIERDPLYAEAYAGLASAYLILADWGGGYGHEWERREESFRQAQEMAERALEQDSTLSLPHGVIAWVKIAVDWDWDGAEREFLAGLERDPDQSQLHGWYSGFLAGMGRTDDALRQLAAVERLDPLSPWLANGPVVVYYLARQYNRAIEAGIEGITAYPDMISPYGWLCNSYLASGRIDEGMEACREAAERDPRGGARMAIILAHRGEREAALQELEEALANHGDRGSVNFDAAIVHAVLGNLDEAFPRLRRYITQYRSTAIWVPAEPIYDPFRADPRWEEILDYIGFGH
ncbi:tetratricopeptide repeat protein [Gemmatimonadota bacterium]